MLLLKETAGGSREDWMLEDYCAGGKLVGLGSLESGERNVCPLN